MTVTAHSVRERLVGPIQDMISDPDVFYGKIHLKAVARGIALTIENETSAYDDEVAEALAAAMALIDASSDDPEEAQMVYQSGDLGDGIPKIW